MNNWERGSLWAGLMILIGVVAALAAKIDKLEHDA